MTVNNILLNDGYLMPRLGCGLWQVDELQVESLIPQAIGAGFRHFDTAQAYFNEEALGRALRHTEIPREQLFITSKIRGKDNGVCKSTKFIRRNIKSHGTGIPRPLSHTLAYACEKIFM